MASLVFWEEDGRYLSEEANRLTPNPVSVGKGAPVGAPCFSSHCKWSRASASFLHWQLPPSTKGWGEARGGSYRGPWPCTVQPSAGNSQCPPVPRLPCSLGLRHHLLPSWTPGYQRLPGWPDGRGLYLVLERKDPDVRPAFWGLCLPPISTCPPLPEVREREGTKELPLVASLAPGPRDLDFYEKEGQEPTLCTVPESFHFTGNLGTRPPKSLSVGLSHCRRLCHASHCSIQSRHWEEISDPVSAHPGLE